MRVVIQRVKSAKVHIKDYPTAEIGQGLLVLLGVGTDDSKEDIDWLVKKIVALRIFDDDEGVMNRSVQDVGGDIMVVSQFTLMASTKKGNRPSWIHAAPHSLAIPMYELFCKEMGQAIGKPVATGQFGAYMQVELTNDGPVTIIMDTKNKT
ncbi:MAG: D-tyrosyl-tRNA(Tyr) deacylase [Prevotella sp.]|nr:D-tyrosyl-tRNA(Tyr) deacylase [Prevotella sp.]